MSRRAKYASGAFGIVASIMLAAGPALAHECTNVQKDEHDPSNGAQIVFGCADAILDAKPHALALLESGKFPSGWIAFDVDCDGIADAGTYIVGPMGEIPRQAQFNGSPDNGILNVCTYFGLPLNCFDE